MGPILKRRTDAFTIATSSRGETLSSAVASLCPSASPEAVNSFLKCSRISTRALEDRADQLLHEPYGRKVVITLSPDYGLLLIQIMPGHATSLHFHRVRQEVFFVRRGTLTLTRGVRSFVTESGDLSGSVPLEPHRLSNEGALGLEILELFVPNFLDDITRIEDRYNRPLGNGNIAIGEAR